MATVRTMVCSVHPCVAGLYHSVTNFQKCKSENFTRESLTSAARNLADDSLHCSQIVCSKRKLCAIGCIRARHEARQHDRRDQPVKIGHGGERRRSGEQNLPLPSLLPTIRIEQGRAVVAIRAHVARRPPRAAPSRASCSRRHRCAPFRPLRRTPSRRRDKWPDSL